MNRRILTAAMAMSLSLCAAQTVCAAPLFALSPTASDKPVKVKTISFNLRNDSGMILTVQIGTQQITVQPGKSTALKLPEGTQITSVTATAHVAAGSVLTTVNSNLNGNTLAVS